MINRYYQIVEMTPHELKTNFPPRTFFRILIYWLYISFYLQFKILFKKGLFKYIKDSFKKETIVKGGYIPTYMEFQSKNINEPAFTKLKTYSFKESKKLLRKILKNKAEKNDIIRKISIPFVLQEIEECSVDGSDIVKEYIVFANIKFVKTIQKYL